MAAELSEEATKAEPATGSPDLTALEPRHCHDEPLKPHLPDKKATVKATQLSRVQPGLEPRPVLEARAL